MFERLSGGEFDFVRDMVAMQLVHNPTLSVVDMTFALVNMVRTGQVQPVLNTPKTAFDCGSIELTEYEEDTQQPACEPVPCRQSTIDTLIAPVPTVPDCGDTYDSLIGCSILPPADKLPKEFGTTDYSAAKINSETVAMSIEHYYDLITVRNECQELRQDKIRLEALMMESARRHVSLDVLAKNGVEISQKDSMFDVTSLGFITSDLPEMDFPTFTHESLTKALEVVAERVSRIKEMPPVYSAEESIQCSLPSFEIVSASTDEPITSVQQLVSETVEPVLAAEICEELQRKPMPEFRVGQVWMDRGGDTTEIVFVRENGMCPVGGRMMTGAESGNTRSWTKSGYWLPNGVFRQQVDLITLIKDVPEPPPVTEVEMIF